MRRILLLTAAAAIVVTPAMAQKTAKAPAHVAQLHYIDKDSPALWRASQIKGVDVYNNKDEKIGSIDDVLVDKQGNVKAVVIGVGGFLGVGERNIAVPFNELRWQVKTTRDSAGNRRVANDIDGPSRADLPGATKEQLEHAPEFKYAG